MADAQALVKRLSKLAPAMAARAGRAAAALRAAVEETQLIEAEIASVDGAVSASVEAFEAQDFQAFAALEQWRTHCAKRRDALLALRAQALQKEEAAREVLAQLNGEEKALERLIADASKEVRDKRRKAVRSQL